MKITIIFLIGFVMLFSGSIGWSAGSDSIYAEWRNGPPKDPGGFPLAVLYVTACGEAGVADYVRFNAAAISAMGVRVGVAGPSSSRLATDVSRLTGTADL